MTPVLNAIESMKSATAESVQVPEAGTQEHGKPGSPSSSICDLAEANAFCESYGKPHVPVSVAFGAERLHVCRLQGSWDLERAVAKNSPALIRSIRKLPSKNTLAEWDDLTFRFAPCSYLYADKDRIVGFASTPSEAESLVIRFSKTCRKVAAPAGGTFHLIEQDRYDIRCQTVTLYLGCYSVLEMGFPSWNRRVETLVYVREGIPPENPRVVCGTFHCPRKSALSTAPASSAALKTIRFRRLSVGTRLILVVPMTEQIGGFRARLYRSDER